MQAASDLEEEIDCLATLLAPLSDADFETATQFKSWTINDVLGHLHLFDMAVVASLNGDDAFDEFFAPFAANMGKGMSLLEIQYPWLDGLNGQALRDRWYDGALATADAFAKCDPKRRLKWVGPGMSALSSCTARQMETWAHGHEVFDVLSATRVETDRIINICHLGVNTCGWTFKVRGLPSPEPAPFVELKLPSGKVHSWNDACENHVKGNAVEFAQVVTQTRSVHDTALKIQGANAVTWMENAQCFAGGVEQPPAKGQRHLKG